MVRQSKFKTPPPVVLLKRTKKKVTLVGFERGELLAISILDLATSNSKNHYRCHHVVVDQWTAKDFFFLSFILAEGGSCCRSKRRRRRKFGRRSSWTWPSSEVYSYFVVSAGTASDADTATATDGDDDDDEFLNQWPSYETPSKKYFMYMYFFFLFYIRRLARENFCRMVGWLVG